MSIRMCAASAVVLVMSACADEDEVEEPVEAAVEEEAPAEPAPAPPPAPSAQDALQAAWSQASPGAAPATPEQRAAAFAPRFEQIARADAEPARAFILATVSLAEALQPTQPRACAELPLARFTPENLAAVPASAQPLFRDYAEKRLAAIRAGQNRADDVLPAYSGSMQSFDAELSNLGDPWTPLAAVAAGEAYDPAAACAATIASWKVLAGAAQAPLMAPRLYGFAE